MPLLNLGQEPAVPITYPGELPGVLPIGNPPTAIGPYANMNADAADALLSVAAAVHALASATRTSAAADEQIGFEIDASLLPAGGFQCHLPTGSDITAYSLENNSANNTITVFAGSSPSGRLLNSIPGGHFKAASVPMGITSLCLVPTNAGTGVVRIIITTRFMAIGQGLCAGVADAEFYTAYPGGSSAPVVVKAGPGTLGKLVNTNTAAQTATLTIYDNPVAASGPILFAAILGPSQVITLDLVAQYGMTAQASAATVAGNPINILAL